MPRLVRPLFSDSAAGSFGEVLQFKSRGSRSVLTKQSTRHKIKSKALKANQEFFKTVRDAWQALSYNEKLVFKRAAPNPLSGWAYYLQLFGSPYYAIFLDHPFHEPWFPCFDYSNVAVLGSYIYLEPGKPSGFWMPFPMFLGEVVNFISCDFEFLPQTSPRGTCSAFFAVSTSGVTPPPASSFLPAAVLNMNPPFAVGSQVGPFWLWFKLLFTQEV